MDSATERNQDASALIKDDDSAKGRDYSRLTRAEQAEILALLERGELEQKAIAALYGVSPSAITRLKQKYQPTDALAAKVLRAHSLDAAEAWAKAIEVAADEGNHKPAMDLLKANGLVQAEQHNTQVAVFVGSGSEAVGPAPVFDLSPVVVEGESERVQNP